MSELPSCAIMVLNWNGIEHLAHLLPSLKEAVAAHPGPVSTVVVDNRSTKGDVEWIREHHPEVEVRVAEANDYLFSLNPAVQDRAEDVVIILNNDMRVDPGFIAPLLEHFADPTVFAASAAVFDWDSDRLQMGQRVMRLRRWWFYQNFNFEVDGPCYTVEAGGGCSAYRRSMFIELGGFDRMYRPAYWEDIDLSYRAWMRGWKSVLEPRSRIEHRKGATLAASRPRRRDGRNSTLFTLKNIGGTRFAAFFLLLLPYRMLRSALAGDIHTAIGIVTAVARFDEAFRGRARDRGRAVMNADEIAATVLEGRPLPTRDAAAG